MSMNKRQLYQGAGRSAQRLKTARFVAKMFKEVTIRSHLTRNNPTAVSELQLTRRGVGDLG